MVSRSWSGGNTAYAYDLQGNLLTATGTEGRTAFSYNAFNQQISVAMPNGNRLESRYDAEYLRAGTTLNGSVTSFSYYNGELLAESSPDGDTISRYILGYGVAAGWSREKEGYHPYHLDEQNSTAYITGINGEIENHYQYDAFGVVQTHQEEIHNRILYTGQQYDKSSGQYYLRARYYNPVVGRFLQEDVYRGDGLNLYAYCKNNPVVYYDPSGCALSKEDCLKIQHDTAGKGYAYYQNQHHRTALKNQAKSPFYEGCCFQSHHLLQGEWARKNLRDYGYSYGRAPTISLGTGYYLDSNGERKAAPHTILNNNQKARQKDRGGGFSSTLHSELVFGATDLLDAGMSEELVFSELERNYKMLDALNEQNRTKISNGKLQPIKYDKHAIEQAVREKAEQKKQEKQNQTTCKDA